jgi:ribosome maturation factor RimP
MDKKELEKLFLPVFERHEIAAHKIRFISGRPGTLEVMIRKSDGSMDMDTCADVSREISALLDECDYGNEAYNLDVCSFGAEPVLETDEEINQSVDRYVHVDLKNPEKGIDKLEGTLKAVTDTGLEIEYNDKGRKKTATIGKDNIRLIRLAVKL